MLVIAQPKTASTSLMAALGELTGLPSTQEFSLTGARPFYREDHGRAPEFAVMPHSDMGAAMPEAVLRRWLTDRACFYKQHLAPTGANIEHLLRINAPVIILTRPVRESCEAYVRVPPGEAGDDFAVRLRTEPELMGILEGQFKVFQERYLKLATEQPRRFRVVDFESLLADPAGTLRDVIAFYGLEARIPDGYQLPKRRYYRDLPPPGKS